MHVTIRQKLGLQTAAGLTPSPARDVKRPPEPRIPPRVVRGNRKRVLLLIFEAYNITFQNKQ
jgi:hypothetical protein